VKIKKLKDYYEILGITKNASEKEIKAAYRKLAIKLHPDKNSAPEAEEAFKKLTAAHEVLSNPEKRSRYDEFGDDAPGQGLANDNPRGHYQQEFMTPDDLLNMFFTGQARGGGQRFYRYQQFGGRRPQQQEAGAAGGGGGGSGFFQFIHFLPIILLILFTFNMGSGSDTSNPFSLTREGHYTVLRKTQHTDIPYYVSDRFSSSYARDPRALRQVEEMVEQQTFSKLEDKCKLERADQRKALNEAKKNKGPNQADLVSKAYTMRLTSCDRWNELFNVAS